jgi:hypothetical protein
MVRLPAFHMDIISDAFVILLSFYRIECCNKDMEMPVEIGKRGTSIPNKSLGLRYRSAIELKQEILVRKNGPFALAAR